MEEIVVSDSWREPVIAGSAWTAILGTGDVATETAAERDGGRKQYAITPSGHEQLEQQRAELEALLKRLGTTRRDAGARGVPEIQRAMGNLKMVTTGRQATLSRPWMFLRADCQFEGS